jgi:hypothetical protein
MTTKVRKTQTQQILDHLIEKKSITLIEAAAMYKTRSLTRRIKDIREMGYNITSERCVDRTGQRYVRYWLKSKRQRKAA